MILATIALAVLVPASPADAPSSAAMRVAVRTAPKAPPPVEAWAAELRAALEARKEEFRLAGPGETAEMIVRIDSVGLGMGDAQVMKGALVMGEKSRPFNLSYHGASAPQAAALARNLRKFAEQMKADPAAR